MLPRRPVKVSILAVKIVRSNSESLSTFCVLVAINPIFLHSNPCLYSPSVARSTSSPKYGVLTTLGNLCPGRQRHWYPPRRNPYPCIGSHSVVAFLQRAVPAK